MNTIYHFNTKQKPELKAVGGKAMSLILMTQAGFPVPAGFVLSVAFFKPWLAAIQKSKEWQSIIEKKEDAVKAGCDKIKQFCNKLAFTAAQQQALTAAFGQLMKNGKPSLMAVRSSSPEEDLESASFAGGYETTLGVTEKELEQAIRHSFASAFDQRVILYKREHGFVLDKPRIAVIVQKQIDARAAGVAFSLNPLNNCYDEVVINANFGLGESVVAGMVTPDTFIVDKNTNKIISQKIGKKDVVILLKAIGGTENKRPHDIDKYCLSPKQVQEITNMTAQVESHYKKPMDIEWAYQDQRLYLLQARPITTHIPLPDEMITPPGEPKKLYMDFTLIGQGIREPFSVLGMEFFDMMQNTFMNSLLGVDVSGLADGFFGNVQGRAFANVSNIMKLAIGRQLIVKIGRNDPLVRVIAKNLDRKAYLSIKLPRKLKGFILKALKYTLNFMKQAKLVYARPQKYKELMLEKKRELFGELKKLAGNKNLSLQALTEKIIALYTDFVNIHSLKLTTASHTLALEGIQKLFKKPDLEIKTKLNLLERGLPDNITIEMGLAMYNLSRFKEIKQNTAPEFIKRLKNKSFSPQFRQTWDSFIENYGFRCVKELDLATARPAEDVALLFKQLYTMALNEDKENNARAVFERAWKEREQAAESLLSTLKGKRVEKFKKCYHTWITLGGYREIHKYILIKMTAVLRQRILEISESLVKKGRIDNKQQMFDLTYKQIAKALKDNTLDLRQLAAQNTEYRIKTAHIKEFPAFIDSRGKIIRPPKKKLKQGEYAGEAISAGVARGKVKVLHEPDEKPLLPGEILVARATDPGWTPLFINAQGVILEVGGMVQHGAVVAREYGKPCVTGIEDATSIFKDGQMIEMDGTQGIVRIIT